MTADGSRSGSAALPPETELVAIEQAALELARLAGDAITASLSSVISIEYKTAGKGGAEPTDPVSEIDRAIEGQIRARLAQRFPAHAIVGEEVETHPDSEADFVWAIDPVDGTSNFINGFPLYCASIGVLFRGVPVVGATWCATSRALRPGVIHAYAGGPLSFEGEPLPLRPPDASIRRPLAGAPGGSPGRTARWDNRVTGSAALEAAFTAAGIFTLCRFGGLRIWDLASGVALARAAGLDVRVKKRGAWFPFERFEPPARVKEDRAPTLRDWSEPLVVGTPAAVEQFLSAAPAPGLLSSLGRLFSWRPRV